MALQLVYIAGLSKLTLTTHAVVGLNRNMSETETEDETLTRLEAALRKIAVLSQPVKPEPLPGTERAVLTATLDHLIARLRTGLGDSPAPGLDEAPVPDTSTEE